MSTTRNNHIMNLFGSILAVILLVLYTILVIYMIVRVVQFEGAEGEGPRFTDGMVYIVTTVGGLISALVVGQLAVSDPGKAPEIIRTYSSTGVPAGRSATVLSYVYLAIWTAVGLACLLVGVVVYPNVSQTVSDIGTTWFGLAIAASYAFFGIQSAGVSPA